MQSGPRRVPIVNHDATESDKSPSVKGFKQPKIPMYDEVLGDTYLHIHDFKNKRTLYDNGALLCKLFPVTLKTKQQGGLTSWWQIYRFIGRYEHKVPGMV